MPRSRPPPPSSPSPSSLAGNPSAGDTTITPTSASRRRTSSTRRFANCILLVGFGIGCVATVLVDKLITQASREEDLYEIFYADLFGKNASSISSAQKKDTRDNVLLQRLEQNTKNDAIMTGGSLKPKTTPIPKAIPQKLQAQTSGNIVDFERQPGVVIATKVHSLDMPGRHLSQMFCLLHYAYNNRVQYDIVIFSAMPYTNHVYKFDELQKIVAPAKLTVVVDNQGLHNMVGNMTEGQQTNLLERCGVKSVDKLTWDHKCLDGDGSKGKILLKYNWQAEFRTLNVWTHPSLDDYSTMLWLDADAFCTKKWKTDPIAIFRRNKLAVLFDNFPGGSQGGQDFNHRYQEAFGQQVCNIVMINGTLWSKMQPSCGKLPKLKQIHGFFHITDLSFYRTPQVQGWMKVLIGNETRLRRRYDDQIAITVPAAVLAPKRSWDMEAHGFRSDVYHNHFLAGKYKATPYGFTNYWPKHGPTDFPEAFGRCRVLADSR